MQNYGYRLGKTIKMKDNTLEHLFEFAPHYGMVKRTENKFRKKEIQNNYELTFTPDLEPQLETCQVWHLRSKT